MVIVHGGFWRQGSSRSFVPEASYRAQNGFAAFAINYPKSRPSAPSWPQVRADVETATAWVMAHAHEYHGDGDRVGLLGGSSGGQLAALVDTARPEDGVAPLAAVSWSGAMDLAMTYRLGNGAAKESLSQLFGCPPHACPGAYVDGSPVSHHERVPVATAHEMNQALVAAHVPHTLVVFKHSGEHAREYECDLATVHGATLTVIDDSLRWLGQQLDQPTSPLGTFCR